VIRGETEGEVTSSNYFYLSPERHYQEIKQKVINEIIKRDG
jgi:hypothetical protein